jgi:hypothetical protein
MTTKTWALWMGVLLVCCSVLLGSALLLGTVTATAQDQSPAGAASWTAVVADVQAAISASPVKATAGDAAAASVRKPRATASFKKALSTAAEQAFKEKKITRWDLARVRLAIAMRPQALAEAQSCCAAEAYDAGLIPDAADGELDGFDWSSLLSFIQEFLPLILDIIKMITVSQYGPPPAALLHELQPAEWCQNLCMAA